MQSIQTRVAQVFWGLIIVGVDFRLGRFDVFPDFAGYFLVGLGLTGLLEWSGQFQLARLLSWLLVPVSMTLMVFQGGLLQLSWVLNVALDGAMMWFFLGGVMEFADSKLRPEWVTRASICRRVYLGLLGAGLFLGWLSPELPSLARVVGSVIVVAHLLLLWVILHMLNQVKILALSSAQPEEVKEAA